jgi:hypothetical protein
MAFDLRKRSVRAMQKTLFHSPAAGFAAGTAIALSVLSFAVIHLSMSDTVHPLTGTVSTYALAFPGNVLFPTGAMGLAVACAVLAGRGVGLPRQGPIRWILAVTPLLLLATSVFRTGTPETGLTAGAQIHRYSAGAAFIALIVVALLCIERSRGTDVPVGVRRALMWIAVLSLATFAVTTVNTFWPGFLSGGEWRGVPQRVLLAVQSAQLLVLLVSSRGEVAAATAAVPSAVEVERVEPVAVPHAAVAGADELITVPSEPVAAPVLTGARS